MYLRFYGFKEAPFNITPDPRFLFFAQHHREAFDHLIYGIENRKGFIELTGEVGSGKTTICRAVLASLARNVKTSLVLNPWLTENQLLRAILHDFGLAAKGRDRLACLETLNAFLLEQLRQDNNVALIIDEAQDLAPAVLEQVRLLSNLETDQHKLLQIVLCGQPELSQRLAAPDLRQLRQRITVRYHLFPLTEAELKQYIDHRLKTAGWKGDEIFSDEAVRRVYHYSTGIPRLINAVCDVALLAGYVARIRRLDGECVSKAIQQLEGGS
ncbi:MAG: AAA family ATPase [Verrucomicrobia bacterium]|nr:AAA family ATPase [Verrucomicrobiota bacterium]